MSDARFYVLAGGTMVHVAPHFSLCAPAFGTVGLEVAEALASFLPATAGVSVVRTKMALGYTKPSREERRLYEAAGVSRMETNEELARVVTHLTRQADTRCIVMAAAVCDWEPKSLAQGASSVASFGKHAPRLSSSAGPLGLQLSASNKIVSSIRRTRKDIFLVAFKAAAGVSDLDLYAQGLDLLKRSSANLVFCNDVQRHVNLIVTPEEFPYSAPSRDHAVNQLATMIRDRTALTFVRTEVRDEPTVQLADLDARQALPRNFVPVLRHLVERGAYKPFRGRTTGHFGAKVLDPTLPYARVASLRKVDHNRVFERGVAKIYGYENGRIVAGGAKPSVGEHTQHQIYEVLGDRAHSIVHFHCPLKPTAATGAGAFPSASQRPFECGSVQCGENTARNIAELRPGIFAVHLEGHGPNIAFHRDVEPQTVIDFLEDHFDLDHKSGGDLPAEYREAQR